MSSVWWIGDYLFMRFPLGRFLVMPVFCALLLAGCDTAMQTSGDDHPNHLSFKMIEINREAGGTCEFDQKITPCVTVSLRYPEMSSHSDPDMADALNAFIFQQAKSSYISAQNDQSDASTPEELVETFIADHEKISTRPSQWRLERSISIPFNTEKLITFELSEFNATGGAHPLAGKKLFVRSREDGSEVTLADLFNPGYEIPLNVIGERFFRESRRLNKAASLPEQGFSFENGVFALNTNFGVMSEGLRFIFEPYEIAPYAMGFTEFVIPFESMDSLLSEEGLLGHVSDGAESL